MERGEKHFFWKCHTLCWKWCTGYQVNIESDEVFFAKDEFMRRQVCRWREHGFYREEWCCAVGKKGCDVVKEKERGQVIAETFGRNSRCGWWMGFKLEEDE